MPITKALLMVLIAVFVGGCATIVTGTSQKIPLSSDPASVTVTVDGKDNYTTPVTIKLERRRDHVLVFAKEGYIPQEVRLLHVISGAFCGNVLLGGPLGMCADAFTGAEFKLIPTRVHVEMQKKEASQ